MAPVAAESIPMPPCEEDFPIDVSKYQRVAIDPWTTEALSAEQKASLEANIQLCRDAIVTFTSVGGASGYGGHTGGAFDMMPEVCILDAFFNGSPDRFVQTFFDEAGHRVATQYLFSVLRGHLAAGQLLKYRQGHSGLPGHPELGRTPGVEFSSGRLGHMWGMVNGVALGNPGKVVCAFSSDGSQMEGNTAESARVAAANGLNVKLFIDDNDVTIAGHPSEYLKGYNVGKTLMGHSIESIDVDGEDLVAVFKAMRQAIITEGPFAVVLKRPMCPGIEGVEGTHHGHDAVAKAKALKYFEARGLQAAADRLNAQDKPTDPYKKYLGTGAFGATRQTFGESVNAMLAQIGSPEERKQRVLVVDSDLEGSCGLQKIRMEHPEVYISSGIMERGNFSACAGFGFNSDRQGIFGTFAAFQEMIVSEVTMARLNRCNVMCHFSHSGVDDMSDNNCHFGQNNFFADCGLADEAGPGTELFMPADVHQMRKVVDAVFWSQGLRFIYSTRSKVPEILDGEGRQFFGEGYKFKPGRDDVIREGTTGYIVSYGDALYRSLDAVERLAKEGISVGLINKCHLNAVDEDIMQRVGSSGFVLVVESQNTKTGLGVRFGTWLLERGLSPCFARCGTHRDGCGGQWEQAYHQGYDPESVMTEVRKLVGKLAPGLVAQHQAGELPEVWEKTAPPISKALLQQNSMPLGEVVLKIIAETQKSEAVPRGIDANWALDVQSAQTLDYKRGRVWVLGTLTGASVAVLTRHMQVTTVEVQSEILPFLESRAAEGARADFIFLEKPHYHCYELIMKNELLVAGGVMLCDNVPTLGSFLRRVRQDKDEGRVRTLMMPVREGMVALTTCTPVSKALLLQNSTPLDLDLAIDLPCMGA